MKQLHTLPLALLILLLTCILPGCEPRDPCKYVPKPTHETYNLGEETKSRIPYRNDGRDTLVYISDEGDTATLYGQGIDSFYTTESRNGNGDPDCPIWNTWKYENCKYTFKGTAISLLECHFYIREYRSSFLKINLDNSPNEGFISLSSVNNTTLYNDTVTINGVTYNGIRLYRYTSPTDTTKNILYNYLHGILQFKIGSKLWHKNF